MKTREEITAAWRKFIQKISDIRRRQHMILDAYDKKLSAKKIERIRKELK